MEVPRSCRRWWHSCNLPCAVAAKHQVCVAIRNKGHVCVFVLGHQGLRGEAGERGATGFPGARGPGGQKASDRVATKSAPGSIQRWLLRSLTDTLPSAAYRATLVNPASRENRSVLFTMQLKCWFIPFIYLFFPRDYLGLATQTRCKSGRCLSCRDYKEKMASQAGRETRARLASLAWEESR